MAVFSVSDWDLAGVFNENFKLTIFLLDGEGYELK